LEFEKLEDNLVFKILVIDDDKNILKLIEKYLEPLRFQVLTTDNPYTGISLSVKYNPYIITLDIFIPGLR
jgi:two-component system, OmpR family, lantibiotic biosynthesis response regulator NisR/SpaR